jgi:predicted Rossmann fold flavoprotein
MANDWDLIVVGGGAAGYFTAINVAMQHPQKRILIVEKQMTVLSKVRISGGGRCNVTNHHFDRTVLIQGYPRGVEVLQHIFKQFGAKETVQWFEDQGVALKVEKDGRIFPVSDSSDSIISCFMQLAHQHKIELRKGVKITKVVPNTSGFMLQDENDRTYQSSTLVLATGGAPKLEQYQWLAELGYRIAKPVPSLFTFNEPLKSWAELAGISLSNTQVQLRNRENFAQKGALLFTHWGLSGPAILKLSAFEALHLESLQYEFEVGIRWVSDLTTKDWENILLEQQKLHPLKKPGTIPLQNIPNRLWQVLAIKAGIGERQNWAETGKKTILRWAQMLDTTWIQCKGKTTFKEEFVTAGGIELDQIDSKTLESKLHKGLYMAGEILNIDGITGGYNFQAAWSGGYTIARSIF